MGALFYEGRMYVAAKRTIRRLATGVEFCTVVAQGQRRHETIGKG